MNYKTILIFISLLLFLDSRSLSINTSIIKKGSLLKQSIFIGTLKFKESSKIASQQSGIVNKIFVNVGDRVKVGEKLATLNFDILNTELEIKNAKLLQAQFQLEKIQSELDRYKNLLDTQSIALQQYENLEFELKSQNANILALKADLELSKEKISQMTIQSPFDGIVLERLTNVGEWLRVGDPVAQLVNTGSMEVLVYAPSDIAKYLKLRDKVSLSIDDRDYEGFISAIIPQADIRSKAFPVYIRLRNNSKMLNSFFEGMAVGVRLNTSSKISGFIVPRDSIVNYQGEKNIFVVENGKAISKKVLVLSVQDTKAVISGDIREGDLVVVRGQDKLSNGVGIKDISKK